MNSRFQQSDSSDHSSQQHPQIKTQWDDRYAQRVRWKQIHGTCQVPKAEGPLGRWVARQRELRKKGRLSEDREALLQELDFTWNTNEAAWAARFQQLVDWKEAHGHTCVPIAYGELGMWCAKARQLKRKNKLSQERIEKLESIGFTWSTASADWHERFQLLKAFKERHGHTDVPFEGELGWWVHSQRQTKRKGRIIPDRKRLLDSIGFNWDSTTGPGDLGGSSARIQSERLERQQERLDRQLMGASSDLQFLPRTRSYPTSSASLSNPEMGPRTVAEAVALPLHQEANYDEMQPMKRRRTSAEVEQYYHPEQHQLPVRTNDYQTSERLPQGIAPQGVPPQSMPLPGVSYGEPTGAFGPQSFTLAAGGTTLPPLRNPDRQYVADTTVPEPVHPEIPQESAVRRRPFGQQGQQQGQQQPQQQQQQQYPSYPDQRQQ